MKVAVVMMVRDEADIISPCILHWKQLGVTDFYICDNASQDETPNILKRFPTRFEKLNFRLSYEPATDWPGRRVINALKDQAVDDGFNWIFPADADEFLEIPFDDIKDWIKSLGCDKGWGELPYLNILPSGSKYWQRPQKKAFGVIDKSMTICMGNHLIEGVPPTIEVLGGHYSHYSIRNFEQFRQKMLNYMVAFSKNGFNDHPHAENFRKWQERGEDFILELWKEVTSTTA